jgi:hypothetical protein
LVRIGAKQLHPLVWSAPNVYDYCQLIGVAGWTDVSVSTTRTIIPESGQTAINGLAFAGDMETAPGANADMWLHSVAARVWTQRYASRNRIWSLTCVAVIQPAASERSFWLSPQVALMLRKLLQLYAIRAREFSEAVARLGEHERDHGKIEPEFLRLLEEIERRQAHCQTSGEDLRRYVAKEAPGALLSAPGQDSAKADLDVNEIRHEVAAARERYKNADEQFLALTIQAYAVGLDQPEGVEAMWKAGNALRDFNVALERYQVALRRLREFPHGTANKHSDARRRVATTQG